MEINNIEFTEVQVLCHSKQHTRPVTLTFVFGDDGVPKLQSVHHNSGRGLQDIEAHHVAAVNLLAAVHDLGTRAQHDLKAALNEQLHGVLGEMSEAQARIARHVLHLQGLATQLKQE